MAKPLIIAHRGASAEAPENTLAAFRRALALKVDGIELDVQATKDGVPVVFHDDGLRRLTGRIGRLEKKTRAELSKLRVAKTESIPDLAEVLKLVRGRATVQVELKRGAVVGPVVEAIRAARATRWVILASFELRLLRLAALLAPEIPRMLITEGKGGADKLLRQMASVGAVGLSVNYKAVRDRDFIKIIQGQGARLWCWTVNEPAAMRRLAGWSVDGLLSDDPALLQRVI